MIDALLVAVSAWAAAQAQVRAVALIGSHARGRASAASDVDVLLIVDDPIAFVQAAGWAFQFGIVIRVAHERYGNVHSLRVWYENGLEVEYACTDRRWVAPPLDAGTRQVLRDGARVLFERDLILSSAIADAISEPDLPPGESPEP